jgi:hypothetical protein
MAEARVPKRATAKASPTASLLVSRTEPTTAIQRANSRVPKRATTKASQTASWTVPKGRPRRELRGKLDGSENGDVDSEGELDGFEDGDKVGNSSMVPKRVTMKAWSQTASWTFPKGRRRREFWGELDGSEDGDDDSEGGLDGCEDGDEEGVSEGKLDGSEDVTKTESRRAKGRVLKRAMTKASPTASLMVPRTEPTTADEPLRTRGHSRNNSQPIVANTGLKRDMMMARAAVGRGITVGVRG